MPPMSWCEKLDGRFQKEPNGRAIWCVAMGTLVFWRTIPRDLRSTLPSILDGLGTVAAGARFQVVVHDVMEKNRQGNSVGSSAIAKKWSPLIIFQCVWGVTVTLSGLKLNPQDTVLFFCNGSSCENHHQPWLLREMHTDSNSLGIQTTFIEKHHVQNYDTTVASRNFFLDQ